MSGKKTKGSELLRALARIEIVAAIRNRGTASVSEIMLDTSRSRGNVDEYLTELVDGGHVIKGLPAVAMRKGATFVYSAPEGQVRELPESGKPTSPRETVSKLFPEQRVGGYVLIDDPPVSRDFNPAERRDALLPWYAALTSDKAANVLRLIDAGQLTFAQAVAVGLVPAHMTERDLRVEFTPAVLQVVPESRGRPIPAHPSVYRSELQCTPPEPRDPDEFDPSKLITCTPCSEAGGADLPVRHEAPGCSLGQHTHKTRGGLYEAREQVGGVYEVREPGGEFEIVPAPYFRAEFVKVSKRPELTVTGRVPSSPVEQKSTPKAKDGGGQWRGGYTHLTQGGSFELRNRGDGKVEARRILDSGGRGAAVTLDESFALANFIQRPPAQPKVEPDAGAVWVTPKPSTTQPPLPAKPQPMLAGHFGMGSGKADVSEGEDDVDEGGGE